MPIPAARKIAGTGIVRTSPHESTGVLEFLRDTEVVGPNGEKLRLHDQVDVITGVSGGSFKALAYALYGEKLSDEYEECCGAPDSGRPYYRALGRSTA